MSTISCFFLHLRIVKHIEHYTLYQISALNISRSHFNDTASWRGIYSDSHWCYNPERKSKARAMQGRIQGKGRGAPAPLQSPKYFLILFRHLMRQQNAICCPNDDDRASAGGVHPASPSRLHSRTSCVIVDHFAGSGARRLRFVF